MSQSSPILLPNSIASPALGIVVFTMCFIGCFVVGVTLIIGHISENWLLQARASMTVQIIESDTNLAKKKLPVVLELLNDTHGIQKTTVLSDESLIKLLEPWLGVGHMFADLPIPVLIDITVHEDNILDTYALDIALQDISPNIKLSTHGQWRDNLEKGATRLKLLAGGILLCVTIVIVMVIISTIQSGLRANYVVLNLLRLIGAHDRVISRQFESHFLRLVVPCCGMGYATVIGVYYLLERFLPPFEKIYFFLYMMLVPIVLIVMVRQMTKIFVMSHLRQFSKI